MPRMTIYVSDELKTRMDGAGDAVNWSAVAQRAFDLVLREKERRLNVYMYDDEYAAAVKRLKSGKEEFDRKVEEEEDAGRDAGEEWASDRAEYSELLAVQRWMEREDRLSEIDGPVAIHIVKAILKDKDPSVSTCLEWFGLQPTDDLPSDDWACGFMEGAAAVWLEVSVRLDRDNPPDWQGLRDEADDE